MHSLRRVKVSDFPLGGQLVLFAVRHWVRAYRRGVMVPMCAWQSFSMANLDGAYAELCRLLRIVIFRELDVRATRRPAAACLSDAEQRFMRAFETAERGGTDAVEAAVAEYASPAVARAIAASTVRIVTTMAAEGYRIGRPEADTHERPAWDGSALELAMRH